MQQKETSKETNKINSQIHKHNNRGKQEIQFVMFLCLIVVYLVSGSSDIVLAAYTSSQSANHDSAHA